MLLFLRSRRPEFLAEGQRLRSEIAEALRGRLGLDGDAVIRVAEVGCPDRGCPDVETIALLKRPGRPSQAVKVTKSMQSLTPSDLDDLAAQLVTKCGDMSRLLS